MVMSIEVSSLALIFAPILFGAASTIWSGHAVKVIAIAFLLGLTALVVGFAYIGPMFHWFIIPMIPFFMTFTIGSLIGAGVYSVLGNRRRARIFVFIVLLIGAAGSIAVAVVKVNSEKQSAAQK